MKFSSRFLSLAFCALSAPAWSQADVPQAMNAALQVQQWIQSDAGVSNIIRWKVGDFHKMKLNVAGFINGTGRKEATKEEADKNAVWLVNEVSVLGQRQKTEALIDRATGKTLKLIVNGKEQDPGEQGEVEVIEQSETTVTVGAGTFDCFYVKANVTSQGQKQVVELWINPIDVNLDGSLKIIAQSQLGPVTITLEEFGPK
jgi:hypothetical protein